MSLPIILLILHVTLPSSPSLARPICIHPSNLTRLSPLNLPLQKPQRLHRKLQHILFPLTHPRIQLPPVHPLRPRHRNRHISRRPIRRIPACGPRSPALAHRPGALQFGTRVGRELGYDIDGWSFVSGCVFVRPPDELLAEVELVGG